MTKTVVVYHSGYGHTKRLAEAVAEGAGAQLLAIDAEGNLSDSDWATLNAADAILFGSPTYMGNVSWQFKKFADTSSKIWFQQGWKDKVFGGFTNSGSVNGDKQVTLIYLQTLALQHGGIWVSLGILPASAKANTRDDINYLGAFGGLFGRTPGDASVEEMAAGDLETAKLYGKRVAEIAGKLRA
ncbi:MAG: NAD(P)H-dependent oxidoreductase [Zoogloeaceae bacterium]|jgi:multimeric flavodoxin WrbA|nr:NAD(P)H-dependent oxidoreductase [Zoogloeaceae bacterium]